MKTKRTIKYGWLSFLFLFIVGVLIAVNTAEAQVIVPSGFKAEVFASGLNRPTGIAVAPSSFGDFGGHLFIANHGEFNGSASDFISRVSPDGAVFNFVDVGTSDPYGISFGPGGGFGENLFIATNTTIPARGDSRVLVVDPNGTVSTFAFTCCSGSGGLDFDLTGAFGNNMFIGLTGLDGIGKVSSSRSFSIFSYLGPVNGGPVGLKFGPGGDFGTDMFVSVWSLTPGIMQSGGYKISPNGLVSTLVNTSSSALINQPGGLAFSPAGIFGGDLYLTDTANGTILKVTPQGAVSVFASGLSNPLGIAFSGTEILYVGEQELNRVIKISPGATTVAIDIKPGSYPNSINPRNNGVIPVAILTTATFDATTVDPSSVKFGPNEATESDGRAHFEDVDGDGEQDLVLHFKTQQTGIKCGDTEAGLTGKTFSGQDIAGTDTIRTVGCASTHRRDRHVHGTVGREDR